MRRCGGRRASSLSISLRKLLVNMEITQEQIDEMIAHAREDAPNECCGMVAGADGVATRVVRVANAEKSPFRYSLGSDDQYRILKDIEENGEDLAAIYHSHTASAAYPSQTDINLAFYPDSLYLIVSLEDESSPDVRAFYIKEGKVKEEMLSIKDRS